jgi:hypothetical protein
MAAPFDHAVFDPEEHLDECAELDNKAMPYQPAKNPSQGGAVPDFKNLDESDLFELIEQGAHYWRAIEEVAYRRGQDGEAPEEIEDEIRETLDRVPAQLQQDKKWKNAQKSLKKWIARAFKRATSTSKKLRGGGRPFNLIKPQPWPDKVDGAELLEEITQVFRKYVVMSDAAAHAIALMGAATPTSSPARS